MLVKPEDHQKRLSLYEQGYNDKQIASLCGCSASAISRWRHQNNFAPNANKKRQKEVKPNKLAEDVAEARKAGLSYGKWRALRISGGK